MHYIDAVSRGFTPECYLGTETKLLVIRPSRNLTLETRDSESWLEVAQTGGLRALSINQLSKLKSGVTQAGADVSRLRMNPTRIKLKNRHTMVHVPLLYLAVDTICTCYATAIWMSFRIASARYEATQVITAAPVAP